MLSAAQLDSLVARIRRVPEVSDSPVGYYGEARCEVISMGPARTGELSAYVVIIEEYAGVVPESMSRTRPRREQGAAPPLAVQHRSEIWREGVAAGIDCAFAATSWLIIAAGAAAAPASGGATLFGAALAWTGAITGTMLCVNSFYRAVGMSDQERAVVDNDSTYRTAVGAVSVLNVTSSAGGVARGAGAQLSTTAEIASMVSDSLQFSYGIAAPGMAARQSGSPRRRTPPYAGGEPARMSSLLVHVFPRGSSEPSNTIPVDSAALAD